MNIENFREHCLQKAGVTEELPFDDKTLVFKVLGKMFALTDLSLFDRINLKCDPEKAIALREAYAGVTPGYHMNKKHWNTIALDGSIPNALIYQWTDDSYRLVTNGLPRAMRDRLSVGE